VTRAGDFTTILDVQLHIKLLIKINNTNVKVLVRTDMVASNIHI